MGGVNQQRKVLKKPSYSQYLKVVIALSGVNALLELLSHGDYKLTKVPLAAVKSFHELRNTTEGWLTLPNCG